MVTPKTETPNPFELASDRPTGDYVELRDPRAQKALQIAIFNPLTLGAALLFFIPMGIQTGQWQFYAIAGALLAVFVASMVSITWIRSEKTWQGVLLMTVFWQLAWITVSGVVSNVGLPIAAVILMLTILFAAETLDSGHSTTAVIMAIFASITSLLINTFAPIPRITMPTLEGILPYLLGGLLLVYIILLIDRFSDYTLQIKLVTIFFAIVLIPLSGVSYLFSSVLTNTVTQDTNSLLQMASIQVGSEVDDFIYTTLTDLRTDAQNPILVNYLSLSETERQKSSNQKDLILLLGSIESRDRLNIDSYAVLDKTGVNIYDTLAGDIGKSESLTDYFLNTTTQGIAFVTPVVYSKDTRQAFITFSSPIRDDAGNITGVLRARYDAAILQQILNKYIAFIGPRSYPILVDNYNIRLADSAVPTNIARLLAPVDNSQLIQLRTEKRLPDLANELLYTQNQPLAAALEHQEQFFVDKLNPITEHPDAGAIYSLKNVYWRLIFIQDQSVFLAPIEAQIRNLVLIAVMIAGLIAAIALITSHFLAQPIVALTQTAQIISTGNLSARARIRSQDEIGTLAKAFNQMTEQLQSLVTGLEERVLERTRELAQQSERMKYRATQLQTIADVARAVTSVQELENLLTTMTHLISERFGHYHVGIFMVDDKKEYAVLKAANSQGGQQMLARHHRLKVGQVGIVGFVTGYGKPRVATDVGVDAVFFNNPNLPDTRSEMAIPLNVGDTVIGALDIQSKEVDVFTEEEVSLFTTLADQVAVAIENNRLFSATRDALKEAQEIHRQYLRQEWSRETSERGNRTLRYTDQGIEIIGNVDLPEIQDVIKTSQVSTHVSSGEDQPARSALAVPIKLRGMVIGVIDLQETQRDRKWTSEEIAAVQSVADQIALALENARLFEQTVRRADRERKVLEITSKIRTANDPQTMLQTALTELQRTLKASRAQILLQPAIPALGLSEEHNHIEEDNNPGSNGYHNDPGASKNGNGI